MCGITGFLDYAAALEVASAEYLLETMGNAIQSRGPDSAGFWFDKSVGVGLSHRRLAILDLSPMGNQPMQSACGRFVLIFNGEIYNHQHLRNRLYESGHTFSWRGNSDTETLLECLCEWGIDKTLKSIVGMFAFAVWDRKNESLILARDRMGEKPLYWGWSGSSFLFGSELKAIKTHPKFTGVIDRDSLSLFFSKNYIPAPASIYLGYYKLPPGSYIKVNRDSNAKNIEPQFYWRLSETVNSGYADSFSGSDEESVNYIEHQLGESIADQMISDVPLGAFLSGGVDSSLVVALMQKHSTKRVRTFTVGFGKEAFNEANHARAVADYLDTDHTEFYMTSEDALAVIPNLSKIYCEPFADSSQIPTLIVSQLARQHVTVALSGDGGDEIFGGYPLYQLLPKLWRYLSCLPLPMRRAIQCILEPLPMNKRLSKLRDVLSSRSNQELFLLTQNHWQNSDAIVIGAREGELLSRKTLDVVREDCFEHWMMAQDANSYLPDDILVKVDRASMASSLETRVPLLDHRLVELAWKLPIEYKIRGGVTKWGLREVLYRHVPKKLIERPKQGFAIPIGDWLRGPLRDWAESLLEEKRLIQEGYLNPEPIRQAWRRHISRIEDNSTKLWSILMFQAWLDEQSDE